MAWERGRRNSVQGNEMTVGGEELSGEIKEDVVAGSVELRMLWEWQHQRCQLGAMSDQMAS